MPSAAETPETIRGAPSVEPVLEIRMPLTLAAAQQSDAPSHKTMAGTRCRAKMERPPSPDAVSAASALAPSGSATGAPVAAAKPEAPLPPLVDRYHVVEQVLHRIETLHLAHGRQELVLRLHPEHLGEVRLTIEAEGTDVAARIVTDTPLARQAMDAGREDLRAALEQRGFHLMQLDVSLDQRGGGGRFLPFPPDPPPSPPTPFYSLSTDEEQQASTLSTFLSAPSRREGRVDYRA
jgi:flagellar hook-length control protein FliK